MCHLTYGWAWCLEPVDECRPSPIRKLPVRGVKGPGGEPSCAGVDILGAEALPRESLFMKLLDGIESLEAMAARKAPRALFHRRLGIL